MPLYYIFVAYLSSALSQHAYGVYGRLAVLYLILADKRKEYLLYIAQIVFYGDHRACYILAYDPHRCVFAVIKLGVSFSAYFFYYIIYPPVLSVKDSRAFFLIIPPFSKAMLSIVLPKNSVWSRLIDVITLRTGFL